MIHKKLDEIDCTDVQSLVADGIRESRTIEYKQQLPGNSDSDKIHFLAEVSAFANTDGGDVIYGIKDEKGLPKSFAGIQLDNADAELLRLEQLIRNGLDPKIQNIRLRAVPCADKAAIIIRVPKSFEAPHRVSLKDHAKFYARNSAGKFPMDTSELRSAFLSSEALPERIRLFRERRIYDLRSREGLPVLLEGKGLTCLHIFPLVSFTSQIKLPIFEQRGANIFAINPPGASYWDYQFNLEGIVTFSGARNQPNRGYTQLYRNGSIEAVEVLAWDGDKKYIPSVAYEESAIRLVSSAFNIYRKYEIEAPIIICLSFVDIFDFRLAVSRGMNSQEVASTCAEILIPEIRIIDLEQPVHQSLRPLFDMVWNAFGYTHSFNYDQNGEWVRPC